MDLTAPVFQSALTVLAGVLVYVLGQAIVKLIEPALSLRTLIGKIAGDLVMYANRAETVASAVDRMKLFRRHASDLFQSTATVVGYEFFTLIRILPAKSDVEKAASLLISYANSQSATGAQVADYEPFKTSEEIKALLRISKHEEPRTPSTPGPN